MGAWWASPLLPPLFPPPLPPHPPPTLPRAGGKGAWGAVDAVGGALTEAVAGGVRAGGTVFLYGMMDGTKTTVSIVDLLFRGVVVTGYWVGGVERVGGWGVGEGREWVGWWGVEWVGGRAGGRVRVGGEVAALACSCSPTSAPLQPPPPAPPSFNPPPPPCPVTGDPLGHRHGPQGQGGADCRGVGADAERGARPIHGWVGGRGVGGWVGGVAWMAWQRPTPRPNRRRQPPLPAHACGLAPPHPPRPPMHPMSAGRVFPLDQVNEVVALTPPHIPPPLARPCTPSPAGRVFPLDQVKEAVGLTVADARGGKVLLEG